MSEAGGVTGRPLVVNVVVEVGESGAVEGAVDGAGVVGEPVKRPSRLSSSSEVCWSSDTVSPLVSKGESGIVAVITPSGVASEDTGLGESLAGDSTSSTANKLDKGIGIKRVAGTVAAVIEGNL
jgi:hypothetical protein